MDEKKIIAMAVAAIAEETGEDIHMLRVVSFRKVVKSGLAQYLEKNHINYTKYQLGDESK